MPTEVSDGVRSGVGARGFSAYVTSAVARPLERDALDDALARMREEHGPADETEIEGLIARLSER